MKYHNITQSDMLNGPDLGVVLWVSGCNHHCPHCQNPLTHDPDDGIEFNNDTYRELAEALAKDYHHRFTISGGDPLHPANRNTVNSLILWVHKNFPDVKIVLYTGYTFTNLMLFKDENDEYFTISSLEYVDILMSGPFKYTQRQLDIVSGTLKKWVGDSSQKVIDMHQTLLTGSIVELE